MNNIDKILICEFCGKEITEDYRKEKKGPVRFCSRKCANSFSSHHIDHDKLKDSFCSVCGEPITIKNNATSGRCDKCKSKHIYRYPKDCVLGNFERSYAYTVKSINLKRLGFDFNNDWELEFFKVRDILYEKYYRERMSYLELKKHFGFPSHKNIPEYLRLFGFKKLRSVGEGVRISFQKGTSTLNTPSTSKYYSGWEDNNYYRSSYELFLIQHLRAKGIEFQCNTFKIAYKKVDEIHTAFPDFYIPSMNLLVEMKGLNRYNKEDLKCRYESIQKLGLDFIVLTCKVIYKKEPKLKEFRLLDYFGNENRLEKLLDFFGIKST